MVLEWLDVLSLFFPEFDLNNLVVISKISLGVAATVPVSSCTSSFSNFFLFNVFTALYIIVASSEFFFLFLQPAYLVLDFSDLVPCCLFYVVCGFFHSSAVVFLQHLLCFLFEAAVLSVYCIDH